MTPGKNDWLTVLRAFLVLGRVQNLPTVWSNCLAGWLLSGGGSLESFRAVCLGATCLYLGGSFLSDVCDASSDVANQRQRPIPAGAVTLRTAYLWSLAWFGLGMLILALLGKTTAVLAALLLGSSALYSVVHHRLTFAPVLMGFCRLLVYLLAGSTTWDGISGLTIWSGLAQAFYVTGVGFLAGQGNKPAVPARWPSYLMVPPVGLAAIANTGWHYLEAGFCALLYGGWTWCYLQYAFGTPARNLRHTVSGLMAGIVLVDLLAVAGGSIGVSLVFLLWFVSVILFQRI